MSGIDLEGAGELRIRDAHEGGIWPIAFGEFADGSRVIASCDGGGSDSYLCAWDAISGDMLWRYEGDVFADHGAFQVVTFSCRSGDRFGVATEDGVVVLDGRTGTVHDYDPPRLVCDTIWSVSAGRLSGGSSFIVGAGNQGVVHFWDAESGSLIREFSRHRGPVRTVDVIHDPGRAAIVVSGDESGFLYRQNADTGEALGGPISIERGISQVKASCSEYYRSFFACVDSSNVATIWDARTGENIGSPISMGRFVTGLALLGSGKSLKIVASNSESIVRQWDAVTGEYLGELQSGMSVAGGTLASGESVVVIGAEDGSILRRPI